MKYFRGPKMPEAYARMVWCEQTFGKSFQGKKDEQGWHWSDMRWYRNGGYLFFKYEQDLTCYLLRWT